MTDYLLEQRQQRCGVPQMRKPRRRKLSGCVAVHTTESIVDVTPPDRGAENVAEFILGRCDYGSYHVIVDADGPLHLAPDDAETWNVAASLPNGYGHNSHIWGIAAACRSTDWDPDDQWSRTVIDLMGREIAAFWARNGFDAVATNPRWLSKAEADAEQPGLILHGTVQPWDRSDAWRYHPRRSELDDMLLAAIRRHAGAPPSDSQEDELMTARDDILRRIDEQDATLGAWMKDTRTILENAMGAATLMVPNSDEQWLVVVTPNGLARYHVKDPAELALLIEAQVVRQGQPGAQFAQAKRLTDPAQIAKLLSLPVIG